MKKRIGPLCSACIEAKEIYGFGDGGHACTCEYASGMSHYVLRVTEIHEYHGWRPVRSDRPLYLYKSVGRDRQHGYPKYSVCENIEDARTWATRAGAEGYLAAKFNDKGYIVEEVAA